MGLLDEKRYADNMTRSEVADALKNGHPLVASYLVADAAKQMQENDALLKVLEQQSGISEPGQSITDKLETYLRKPDAAQQQRPGGPGPRPQGRLSGAGGPMPGPSGAGDPMPGPRVPGGAGGPMPGMLRGPQGAGAPMRRGGIVGFQNGGSPDELEWTGRLADVPSGSYTKGTRQLDDPFKDLLRLLGRGGANVYGQALRGKRGLALLASMLGRKYNGDEHGPYRNPEGELLMEGLGSKERWDPERRGYSGMKRLVDPEEEVPGYQNGGLVESGADFGERGLRDSYRDFLSSWQDPLLERFGIDVDALNTPEERDRRARMEENTLEGVIPSWIGPKAVLGFGKSALTRSKPALDLSTKALGGIRSLYGRGRSALDVGAGRVAEQIGRRGGRPGRWLSGKLTGGRHTGAQFVDPRSGQYVSRVAGLPPAGHSMINRLAGTGAGVFGAGYLADLLASGDGDNNLDDDVTTMARRQGVESSPTQDLLGRIAELQGLAAIPSASELAQYKLDEDRAKSLGGHRAGIEALMPTKEQYRLRGRGKAFSALSGVLGRTGDPRKRQDFGQIGEAINEETDRQLLERLGFEGKLAGIDTDIYGVEKGSLGERAQRERAGDAFIPFELRARQAEITASAAARRQDEIQIAGLYKLLKEQMSKEDRQMIMREIMRLSGGGSSMQSQVDDVVADSRGRL